jgi:hypothetical protein
MFMSAVVLAMMLLVAVAGGSWAEDAAPAAGAANLAVNPGFEEPGDEAKIEIAAGWESWASKDPMAKLCPAAFHSGSVGLEFTAQGEKNVYMVVLQKHPVVPGKEYSFEAYVRNSTTAPLSGSAVGSLGIEWQSDGDTEISRVSSDRWKSDLSRLRWNAVRVTGTAPENAVAAKFVIFFTDGDTSGSGKCYVDDVTIAEK